MQCRGFARAEGTSAKGPRSPGLEKPGAFYAGDQRVWGAELPDPEADISPAGGPTRDSRLRALVCQGVRARPGG